MLGSVHGRISDSSFDLNQDRMACRSGGGGFEKTVNSALHGMPNILYVTSSMPSILYVISMYLQAYSLCRG
jgi:hypothetical protein